MQQYQVPQFIEVEDRIIGPLTLKQFFYLLAGAGVVILGWVLLHFALFVLIAVPIAALFTAMAFVKVHGLPFTTVFANMLNYYLQPRLYLWRHTGKEGGRSGEARLPSAPPPDGKSAAGGGGKLDELAWIINIQRGLKR